MTTKMTDDQPRATPEEIEAAVAEIRRLEPAVQLARRSARRDHERVLTLQSTLKHYRFLLRFRGVEQHYELWPVGVMVVVPFASGACLWTASFTCGLGALLSIVWFAGGAAVAAGVCSHLLWRPPTAEIQRLLPELTTDLAAAEAVRQESAACLEVLEKPYWAAVARHRQLTARGEAVTCSK